MKVKVDTGTGASMDVTLPNTTSKPDGDMAKVQGVGKGLQPPPFGGNTPIKTDAGGGETAPNRIRQIGGDHGGTVDTSPQPKTKGMPGLPGNQTIPNR